MVIQRIRVFGLLALAVLFLSPLAWGQRRSKFSVKESGSGPKLKLETVRGPEYKDSRYGSGAAGYWGAINLEFELDNKKDEWIDELEVYCKILIETKDGKGLVLENSFFYIDVCCGDKNRVVLYIPPTFFRRHLEVSRPDMKKINVYMELRVDGSPIHRNVIVETNTRIPKDWYKMTDRYRTLTNIILLKSKTPFAPLDYDYYILERPGQ